MYKPPNDQTPDQNSSDSVLKKILLWNGGMIIHHKDLKNCLKYYISALQYCKSGVIL